MIQFVWIEYGIVAFTFQSPPPLIYDYLIY